jgi:hypothetical protein
MADKLSLYNGALREVGERKLASLSENREPRRVLDSAWDAEAVLTCLAAAQWNFATNSIELTHSPSVEPAFGFTWAFDKPENWVRTTAVCEDERFNVPLLHYRDEGRYWYADQDPIYVSYVDAGPSFGLDYGKWPINFTRYVECFLGARICMSLTQNKSKRDDLETLAEVWLTKAKSTDAMDEPTKFPPPGTWSRSRHGRGSSRNDRGPRSRLLG